jgi:thioesterase domain-containing protein
VPQEHPLYGLQDRGLDADQPLFGSLRETAAEYIGRIQAVQPSGPYHLLGFSLGGMVAHEMAVQLRALGEEALPVIIDTYARSAETEAEPGAPRPAETGEPGAAEPAGPAEHVRRARDRVLPAIGDEELTRMVRVFHNAGRIAGEHEFGCFDGDVLVITAAVGRPADVSPAREWRPYVSGVITEHRLDCEHTETLKPENLAAAWAAVSAWLAARG